MTNSDRKKVLVVALSGIGNFLMQSPTIEAIKKSHPNWHIAAWVAPRGTLALVKYNPSIGEVFEAPYRNSLAGQLKTIRYLRRQKFDIGIVLSPGQLIKSALYLFLASIPRRIGHSYPLFGRDASLFLTNSIPEDSSLHDIEQNLQLLKLLPSGLAIGEILQGYSLQPTHYSLSVPLKFQKRAETLLQELKVPTTKHFLGLHPGSAPSFLWKRWPLSNFATLAQYFINRNYHVLIFGGKDEGKLKRKLKGRLGANTTLIETDLLTCAAIMQKCSLFVSNDSGLMHVAAAADAKTFGLFGPTDEAQTGPRGKDSFAIRAPGTRPVYHTEKNFNLGNKPHETMRALTVEEVLSRISR